MLAARPLVVAAGLALVAGCPILCGCATRSIDLAPARPDRPWVPVIDAGGEIKPGAKPSTSGPQSYVLPGNPSLGIVPPAAAIDRDHPYTLPELVDMAETANPQARGAWDEAKEAALAVGLARSAYLPRLTAVAAGIAETSHSDHQFNTSYSDGNGNGHDVLAALSLEWLLFDFGQRRAMVSAAEQLSIASNIRFDATHQKIVRDVSVAFYAAASAHAESENADHALADALEVETAVAARRANGQATVVEVARAREASAQTRLAAVQAHGHETDARIALLAAVGVSPLAPIRLATIPYRVLATQDGIDAEALVSQALSHRPDMLAALAQQKAAADDIEAARADFRPKVFLSSGASYQSGHLDVTALSDVGGGGIDNLNGSSRSVHAIVGVKVPLYDGGTRSAHVAQARAREDGMEAQLSAVRDRAIVEIVVARTKLETSIAAYTASNDLLYAAQISFDAALGAYRNGVGSLTDVSMAEISLMNARNSRSTGYSAALSAAASLALATGDLGGAAGLSDQP